MVIPLRILLLTFKIPACFVLVISLPLPSWNRFFSFPFPKEVKPFHFRFQACLWVGTNAELSGVSLNIFCASNVRLSKKAFTFQTRKF